MMKTAAGPAENAVKALLAKHACPVPFHEVRTRFLGNIASPQLSGSPLQIIKDLWGGELPAVDSIDDLNDLLEALVQGWPLVRECHMLNGEIDFILKCVSPDLSTFQRFLTQSLTAAPNVASVKTSLVIRAAKDQPGVPFEVVEERVREAG